MKTIEEMYELSKDIDSYSRFISGDILEYQRMILNNAKADLSNVEYYDFGWEKVNRYYFDFRINCYRIVPKPKPIEYEPYTQVKEEWLGKVVRHKEDNYSAIITHISFRDKPVCSIRNGYFDMLGLYINFTWADGSPCGQVKED